MSKQCIVRDLDGVRDTTAPVDCSKAVQLAKSGKWSKNWSLECLVGSDDSAPALEKCICFKNGKVSFFTNDYINSLYNK